MGKALIVKNDPVDGADTHQVTGSTTSSPPAAYTGTGDYQYQGAVTGGLSEFVTVNGIPLAVVTSTSSLRAEGATAHQALSGGNYQPPAPAPNPATLTFTPATGVGDGKPGAAAGSALLTAGGAKALLDGDPFDTCGIPGGKGKGTVTAQGQAFVTCSV
ncbi:hypothetical protein GA0070624_5131 [Micromonospora rhizosphaerae]|uniref:Uncharacterized protein n=1 Tax=Micromonospora rhizosphaerae TaxID=568872 RepID=A0A1C6SZY7_9ACTN|nr:hypothetical protein [Micromonospora rhizosphaerae]SCL34969.1 hypothetical protein GA0070624_5131 [Micromonospora rhizosphaerae]